MRADFGGVATKAGLKCSDGRTIMKDAFKHQDGQRVPLVWHHGGAEDPEKILGHAVLEAKNGDMYAHAYFNSTRKGQASKVLVEHKDIESLSIYANQLVERGKQVFHGVIREVSLVMAGANPGAKIDFVAIQHADGSTTDLEDEAIIWTGLKVIYHDDFDDEIAHDESDDNEDSEETEETDDSVEHSADQTIREIFNGMTDEQKNAVAFIVGEALGSAGSSDANATHSDNKDEDEDLEHQEGSDEMTRNAFDQDKQKEGDELQHDAFKLTRDHVREIMHDALRSGRTLRMAVEDFALEHGINDIDVLFPDAKTVDQTPQWDKRRTEWVAGVLNGVGHTPFAKVKTQVADITLEDARAKGYVKGSLKKEEWFGLSQRTTGPTTVYKKQKLDRDDVIDITSFDPIVWMKGEIRLMLEEEIARAILIGDGRAVDDEDKIKDPVGATDGTGIRSILNDHELFVATSYVNLDDANSNMLELTDKVTTDRHLYKGTGTPTFYTTEYWLSRLLLTRDAQNRRFWKSVEELASEMRVSNIVTVEVMEDEPTVVGILVNLIDYNVGTDRGGEISFFDDFDLDYNALKFLMETRMSGALTKIRSAIVFKKTASTAVLTVPNAPTFNEDTNVVTIVATTGIVYKNAETGATLSTGAQAALTSGQSLTVRAVPASSSYYVSNNVEDEWTFTFQA